MYAHVVLLVLLKEVPRITHPVPGRKKAPHSAFPSLGPNPGKRAWSSMGHVDPGHNSGAAPVVLDFYDN
jgi:hypothetical protein